MNRPRPTLLRLAFVPCLLGCVGTGLAADGPSAARTSVGALTSVIEPMTRQVVQRRDDNLGNILFVGTFTGPVDGIQARSFLRPGMAGMGLGWTALIDVSTSGGFFLGILRQPAGGFYDLQVRPTYQGLVGGAVNVYAVGVGEVFITAGQSNATNWGSPTGLYPDVRVSAFHDGIGRGISPTFPGASWQYGIDPQPALDLSTGGSAWPTMASDLALVMGVPVGLYAAGFGGTSVEQWLPGAVFKPAGVGVSEVSLFDRLTNAIEYFSLRGGVRAVLWIQGEADFTAGTSPQAYEAGLRTVIDQSRQVTRVPIKWMVARTTTPTTVNLAERLGLEAAQAAVVDGELTFPGPVADSIPIAYRIYANGWPVHFNATGLELLGGYWATYVYNLPGFLGAGFLPAP